MSLDAINLVLETEKQFDISLAGRKLDDIRTVRVYAEMVEYHVRAAGHEPLEIDVILRRIADILVNEYGFRRDEIRPDSRFVQDLGF